MGFERHIYSHQVLDSTLNMVIVVELSDVLVRELLHKGLNRLLVQCVNLDLELWDDLSTEVCGLREALSVDILGVEEESVNFLSHLGF